ncbi:MAG TPA: NADAR family protein [Anaerolineaceae bacterium]|nr:NADAR family protein [Anaerolineaceae bacterium]HRV18449.1 NADAR family protein [Myxococcota bacterium]
MYPIWQADQNAIVSFSREYYFLSNFYPAEVYRLDVFDPFPYRTVEHAFQAAKAINGSDAEAIRMAKTPTEAKLLGRHVTLRSDWDIFKISVMSQLLLQKFSIGSPLRERLRATGSNLLIEGNTWGDQVWGCTRFNGEWIGQNLLGIMLMQVRDTINR